MPIITIILEQIQIMLDLDIEKWVNMETAYAEGTDFKKRKDYPNRQKYHGLIESYLQILKKETDCLNRYQHFIGGIQDFDGQGPLDQLISSEPELIWKLYELGYNRPPYDYILSDDDPKFEGAVYDYLDSMYREHYGKRLLGSFLYNYGGGWQFGIELDTMEEDFNERYMEFVYDVFSPTEFRIFMGNIKPSVKAGTIVRPDGFMLKDFWQKRLSDFPDSSKC